MDMTGTIIICLVIAILAAIAIWLVESIALRHVSTPHYPKPPKKGEPCERALVLTKTDYARMQPRGRFCLIGWGAAAVEGLIFPVVCLYYLPPLIVSYIVMKVNRRPGRALRGTDAALSLELIATLIVIPVVGLIATVGTSTSFYLLSAAQTSTIPGPLYLGWLFLAGTVVISAELVWLMVRVYTRHNSGQDVWFFQADAKPGLAIDRLLESRACRASGFLPGRFIQAAQWADNHVDTDEDSNDYLKFKEAICLLLAHRTTRRQLLTVAFFMVLGLILILCNSTNHLSNIVALGAFTAATFIVFPAAAAARLMVAADQQLRLKKRAQVMHCRLRPPHTPTDTIAAELETVRHQLTALTTAVTNLQAPTSHRPQLISAARRWRHNHPGRPRHQ